MGEIVPFNLKERRQREDFCAAGINELLKQAVELRKRVLEDECNGLYYLRSDLSDFIFSKICSVLLKEKMVRGELFLCGLYLARMIDSLRDKIPKSYYAIDYFVEGIENNDSAVVREGADYCAMVCIFFEGRKNWRAMRPQDYEKMGSSLYHAYYHLTRKPIGYHMGKNLEIMIPVARRSIESLKN